MSVPEDVKRNIRSVLLSSTGGCQAALFFKDYQNLCYKKLLPDEHGFKSLKDLMLSIPDVCRVSSVDGNTHFYGIVPKSMFIHSALRKNENFVRVKPKKSKKKYGGFGHNKKPSAPHSMGSRPPTFFNQVPMPHPSLTVNHSVSVPCRPSSVVNSCTSLTQSPSDPPLHLRQSVNNQPAYRSGALSEAFSEELLDRWSQQLVLDGEKLFPLHLKKKDFSLSEIREDFEKFGRIKLNLIENGHIFIKYRTKVEATQALRCLNSKYDVLPANNKKINDNNRPQKTLSGTASNFTNIRATTTPTNYGPVPTSVDYAAVPNLTSYGAKPSPVNYGAIPSPTNFHSLPTSVNHQPPSTIVNNHMVSIVNKDEGVSFTDSSFSSDVSAPGNDLTRLISDMTFQKHHTSGASNSNHRHSSTRPMRHQSSAEVETDSDSDGPPPLEASCFPVPVQEGVRYCEELESFESDTRSMQTASPTSPDSMTQIYLGKFPLGTEKKDVEQFLSQHNIAPDHLKLFNPKNPLNLKYCILHFETSAKASHAMNYLNGLTYDNFPLKSSPSYFSTRYSPTLNDRSQYYDGQSINHPGSVKVLVSNFAYFINWEDLMNDIFDRYGALDMIGLNNTQIGLITNAIVWLPNMAAANKLIEDWHCKFYGNRIIYIKIVFDEEISKRINNKNVMSADLINNVTGKLVHANKEQSEPLPELQQQSLENECAKNSPFSSSTLNKNFDSLKITINGKTQRSIIRSDCDSDSQSSKNIKITPKTHPTSISSVSRLPNASGDAQCQIKDTHDSGISPICSMNNPAHNDISPSLINSNKLTSLSVNVSSVPGDFVNNKSVHMRSTSNLQKQSVDKSKFSNLEFCSLNNNLKPAVKSSPKPIEASNPVPASMGGIFLKMLTDCFGSHLKPWTAATLPDSLDAVVTYIISEKSRFFWIQDRDSQELSVVLGYQQAMSASNSLEPFNKKGSRCAALFQGGWYRACIIDYPTKESAMVLFIDYGNVETVKFSELRSLADNFWFMGPQAIPCRIIDSGQITSSCLSLKVVKTITSDKFEHVIPVIIQ